jgi:hypothetical protein
MEHAQDAVVGHCDRKSQRTRPRFGGESGRRAGPARLLRASASPMPGKHRGEQHACERQCLDALAGPQRSRDSGA